MERPAGREPGRPCFLIHRFALAVEFFDMRVFLYEYTSARPPEPTGSLHSEGWAMLQAVVEDFGNIPGLETMTLVHETSDCQLGHSCQHIGKRQEQQAFRRLAAEADFTLVIAPEFDDILVSRCRWVLEAGGRLLGAAPQAVSMAADKYVAAKTFEAASIQTPVTILCTDQETRINSFPAVLKPRFGAGSQATFLVRTKNYLEDALLQAAREMPDGEFILQPFVAGLPASVAFLVGPAGMVPLLPAAQHLSSDGRFRYQGGEVPLPAGLPERALKLASRAVAAIPGLLCYIGVDLVLGEAEDGSQDFVIEINPRLTTSYIGLRRLARTNLAQALLELTSGKATAPLEWRPGIVRFLADGTLLP